MKVLKQWQRTCAAVSRLNESGGAILNVLEPVDEVSRGSSEKGVTVVNVAHHISVHKLAGGVFGDKPPDLSDSMEVIKRFLANVFHLVRHAQVVVKHDSEIACGG